jgi:hypothetical protein
MSKSWRDVQSADSIPVSADITALAVTFEI